MYSKSLKSLLSLSKVLSELFESDQPKKCLYNNQGKNFSQAHQNDSSDCNQQLNCNSNELFQKKLMCNICYLYFDNLTNLLNHQLFCKRYTCFMCRKEFITCSALKLHNMLSTCYETADEKKAALNCFDEVLNKNCKPAEKDINYKRVEDDINYKCLKCRSSFVSMYKFVKHMQTTHYIFSCPICHQKFVKRFLMEDHMHQHICKTDSLNETLMKSKSLILLKGNSYVCEVCHKVCSTKKAIAIHFRKHTGEKPFSCEICFRKFYTQVELTRHEHLHGLPRLKPKLRRPYIRQCNICQLTFRFNYELANHALSHKNGIPQTYFLFNDCSFKSSPSVGEKRKQSKLDRLKIEYNRPKRGRPRKYFDTPPEPVPLENVKIPQILDIKQENVEIPQILDIKQENVKIPQILDIKQENVKIPQILDIKQTPSGQNKTKEIDLLNGRKKTNVPLKDFECSICHMKFASKYQSFQHFLIHKQI